MTVLTTDSFNRANSTSSLGTTDGAGTLDPRTWVQQLGTLGINSNQAYASALGSGLGIATVETSQADIDATLKLTNATGGAALCFRFSNASNFWLGYAFGTDLSLIKRVAGGYTVVHTTSGFANGDTIRVVTNGNAIELFRNGVSKSTTAQTHNATATKHGYYVEATSCRVDDFSVSDLVVAPTSVAYVGAIPILS